MQKYQIDKNHKFSVVYTARDEQQASNYQIENVEQLLRLVEAGMKSGFDVETNGGDMAFRMVKFNENPIDYQRKVKELAEKYGVDTEFLNRNANVTGYKPLSNSDMEYVLDGYAQDFSRARNFSHSNFLPTLLAAGTITESLGIETQYEYTPAYVAKKQDDGSYKLEANFTDEDVIKHFQTIANTGAKRGGIKIADGVMPPEYLFRITKKLKEPGVLPSDFVLVCHTHDTNERAIDQYEAFLSAGGNVIHCSHPAFAEGFSQPSVDYFVQNYGNQISNLKTENYQNFIDEGNKVAQESGFKKPNLNKVLEENTESYINRISTKFPDIYKEKFGDITTEEAKKLHIKNTKELILMSGVPGGGIGNALARAKSAGWAGDKVIPKFEKVDFLEEYLLTLIDVKPKIGGNMYVTPNYKNADETAYGFITNPDDPFLRKKDGDRKIYIAARRIFLGEYDPPQGELDKDLSMKIKKEEFDLVLKNSNLDKASKIVLSNEKVFEALVKASDEINDLYKITREKELLELQKSKLEVLSQSSQDTYYSNQLEKVNQKLSEIDSTPSLPKQDYINLMKKGEKGGKIGKEIEKIINNNEILKKQNGFQPEIVGKLLRSVTMLECSQTEVLESVRKDVETQVDKVFKNHKGLIKYNGEVVNLYPKQDAVVLGMMTDDSDPACPKLEQCCFSKVPQKKNDQVVNQVIDYIYNKSAEEIVGLNRFEAKNSSNSQKLQEFMKSRVSFLWNIVKDYANQQETDTKDLILLNKKEILSGFDNIKGQIEEKMRVYFKNLPVKEDVSKPKTQNPLDKESAWAKRTESGIKTDTPVWKKERFNYKNEIQEGSQEYGNKPKSDNPIEEGLVSLSRPQKLLSKNKENGL
jgi:pyruvate/oxaloacetate carboxyltransferase